MPWTAERWPPEAGDAFDTDGVMNEVRAALQERDGLVQAGWVPDTFSRWDPIRGTPAGGRGTPNPTVANFQYEIQEMLDLAGPLRWWDAARGSLYTLTHLCQDAFGEDGWTVDLTEVGPQGQPANRWVPARAVVFGELYAAVNRLDQVRVLPTASEAVTRDSVFRLTWGIDDWAEERAATFALFDGEDDGASVALSYDVGMGADLEDVGGTGYWNLEAREFRITFGTALLDGYTVRGGRLDFTTEAPGGSADFEDPFTAEVVDAAGDPIGTFDSDDYGAKEIAVPADAISRAGDTVLTIRSTRADADDRPAWAPEGPDYTSTYREGVSIAGPVRLIVEVDFEYRE
jgi:hypothetical protein